jgi:hypothetical protein
MVSTFYLESVISDHPKALPVLRFSEEARPKGKQ